jgi:hypothetical protein
MKVYVLPADLYGCGHYRLIWPAQALFNQGVDVTIMPPSKESGIACRTEDLPDGTQKVVSVQVPADADVLVVQRPAHPLQAQMIDILRQNKVAVIIDMDDDMSSIHPNNVAFHTYRHSNKRSPLSWKWAMECCKRATLVTTSTTQLQKVYARHGRGIVIDNYVPEATLNYPKVDTLEGFGWAGTTISHPGDLQEVGKAAQQLVDEGFPFTVVGPPSKVKEVLRLKEAPPCTGSVNLTDWVQKLSTTYAVGMVPLEPTAFNTSKSRLKGIEHMAAGIPWIASPREEYRRLNRESGCGLLAATPKEWYSQLKRLLTDDVLRKEQAEMGRQYMQDQTIQANAWRWHEAWTTAMLMERG